MRGQSSNDGPVTRETLTTAACKSLYFRQNKEKFRLLERLFNVEQPQHIRLATGAERTAMHRLLKAGLVKASKGKRVHRCCGRVHVRYSITLAGKAHFMASKLGLSFPQLCYLVWARNAARNSVFTGKPTFVAKEVDSAISQVLTDFSPTVARKELTRKGFLVTLVWHTSEMTSRFAELERYAAIVEELYLWMKMEYEERLQQAMRDPAIARMVNLVRQHTE